MAVEAYDPCPCGSDKKFKFCCQPISEELAAMERLAADEQPKQVLIVVEKLEVQHATNRVVLRNKFRALMALGQVEDARDVIKVYRSSHPDDAIGRFFDIKWHLFFQPLEKSRELLERDLMSIRAQHPHLARDLVIDFFEILMQAGLFMSARKYLLDGLMWSVSQEEFDRAITVFRRMNSAPQIPFPFRCTYTLQPLPENQPNAEGFAKAWQLAEDRKYLQAAQQFEALCELDEHQPVLSRNAGLCYAWAGDLVASSELLGQAADDMPDFETAVNLETLAQLLEMELPDQQVPLRSFRYRVSSVSRLLTQFGQTPRLIRGEVPPQLQEQSSRVSALYRLVDVAPPEPGVTDVKHLPRVIAVLIVMDEDLTDSSPAELQINAQSPTFNDSDRDFLLQAGDGQLDLTEATDWGELPPGNQISKDRAALSFDRVYGVGLRQSEAMRARNDFAEYMCYEVWPQTPLSALDGISPQKAARNPDAHLPVCAAINVLAAMAEEVGFAVNVDTLRKQLGLPAVQPGAPVSAKEVISLPATEVIRLPFAELESEALANVFALVGASNQAHEFRRLINVAYERNVIPQDVQLTQFCQIAHNQAIKLLDWEGALVWIERGRAAIPDGKDRLQWQIQWDFSELYVAVMTKNMDRVTELLRTFARDYFSKAPDLKDQVWSLLEAERIDDRQIIYGTDFSLVGAAAGSTTPGGLWTPDSPADASAGGKLWVPGQE